MAGVKGKSGGARPGAGRPKNPVVMIGALDGGRRFDSPLAFLLAVMNDAKIEAKVRIDAAKALLPYKHQRQGEARQDKLALALESSGDKWDGLLQ